MMQSDELGCYSSDRKLFRRIVGGCRRLDWQPTAKEARCRRGEAASQPLIPAGEQSSLFEPREAKPFTRFANPLNRRIFAVRFYEGIEHREVAHCCRRSGDRAGP